MNYNHESSMSNTNMSIGSNTRHALFVILNRNSANIKSVILKDSAMHLKK